MPSLSKSVRRSNQYQLGGVSAVLAWPTFEADGTPNVNYVFTAGVITGASFASDTEPYLLEGEIDTVSFSDATQFGANRFPKHVVNIKFNGRSADLNEVVKALDLGKHTVMLRLTSGAVTILGRENGLSSEKDESGAGAKAEDFYGYDLVLSGAETEKAPICAPALFNTLAALVTPAA